jgi:hypothetical protein
MTPLPVRVAPESSDAAVAHSRNGGHPMTSYVIKRSWGTVTHEGSRESCETWVSTVVGQGFEKRSDLVVVDTPAERKALIGR